MWLCESGSAHKVEICKAGRYLNMNNWETSDLSWQEWSEGEGITVIASQTQPLVSPPPLSPLNGGRLGRMGGVCQSCGLRLLRVCDALLYRALCLTLTHCRWTSHAHVALNRLLRSYSAELKSKKQDNQHVSLKNKWRNCAGRLDVSEESEPKLSTCVMSGRLISHVSGTPILLISSSLYAVLMKHDGVSIITDKEWKVGSWS